MAAGTGMRRRRNRRTIFIVFLTAGILSVMAVRSGLELQKKTNANLAELAKINTLLEQEQERTQELAEYSERIGTDEFAAWYARTKMHLVTDNELVIQGKK